MPPPHKTTPGLKLIQFCGSVNNLYVCKCTPPPTQAKAYFYVSGDGTKPIYTRDTAMKFRLIYFVYYRNALHIRTRPYIYLWLLKNMFVLIRIFISYNIIMWTGGVFFSKLFLRDLRVRRAGYIIRGSLSMRKARARNRVGSPRKFWWIVWSKLLGRAHARRGSIFLNTNIDLMCVFEFM